jgi:hypothetical protein
MSVFYLFRVFVQDQSDCDNYQDEWVSFDSVYVAADFGPHDPDRFKDKYQERAVRSELQKIAIHKMFRAVVDKNAGIHTLRTLLLLQQQELIVATDIELYKYDNIQSKDAAILLSSMAFNSKITRHSIDSSDNYDFRFQIVGTVDLRNALDMSGPPGMAEKETQIGLSPPSAGEGRRLVAAFTGIKDSGARDEVIDKYPESLGSFSTRPWRKVSSVRMRFWVEAGLATLSGFLGVLTLFTRDWIEAFIAFDPDSQNGSFEWTIVAALFLVCLLLSIAARTDWRRLTAAELAGI